MREIYSRYFPTPGFLAMNSCALDISDLSLKYGELLATPEGLRLGRFGHEKIPQGVITSGKIENEAELVRILKDLAKREHMHFVRISLPEEQMYLFTLSLPKATVTDVSEAILLQLEEHIPLKAIDTIFDYEIVKETADMLYVQVLAIAAATMESYLSVFQKAGLVPLSFELEAQAIARAIIPRDDMSPVMIVDFGSARTGASIAHNGKVFFTTTLDIGGVAITNMISKNFNMSFEEAEKMKLSYGLSSTANADDIFPAILNGISVLRDELNRHYIYWKTHEDDGFKHEKLDRIILCGGDANLTGLSNYLQASMGVKVENANAWVNISHMRKSVPAMSFEESFGYATVLGLALADYIQEPQTMINVLPKDEKKSIRREYWMRFATTIMSFFALGFAVSILLFLPTYFLSISKSNIATGKLEAFNQNNPDITEDNMNSTVTKINVKLATLADITPQVNPSSILLADLVNNLPPGINLFQIIYNENSPAQKTIDIQGKAADRVALRNFKTSLDNNPGIASTNLPISDFLEKTNISFSISIVLK